MNFITPAYAQAAGGSAGGAEMIMQMAPFAIILVIMYFLIIRPQQKRAKETQNMLGGIRRGDTVVTAGGIIGKVTKVNDDGVLEVEIAEGVKVRILKHTIIQVMNKTEPATAA